jgi:phosphatidate cytidylyltransferase
MTTRIITGLGLLITLIFALYMGGWVFAILWIAAVCLAMWELFRALATAGHRPIAWPTWAALIISIPCFLLLKTSEAITILLAILYISMMLVSILVMFRYEPKLEDFLMSVLPIFAVALPGMCLLALLRVEPWALQRMLLALAFFVPVAGDAAAYFVGVKYGHVKLNEAISPKKTVEGAVGGLLGSMLFAIIVYLVASSFGSNLPPFWHFPLLGLVGGVVSQAGDLFASMVKRHCNIKDYGHIFPGHGGMMDRLDSVLFMSVLVYLYRLFAV